MSFTLPVALALRMCALADTPQTAAVLTAAALGIAICYHIFWHPTARSVMGVSWGDWLAANNAFSFASATSPPRESWQPPGAESDERPPIAF